MEKNWCLEKYDKMDFNLWSKTPILLLGIGFESVQYEIAFKAKSALKSVRPFIVSRNLFTNTYRETNRQTVRQTDTQTDRQTDRQTDCSENSMTNFSLTIFPIDAIIYTHPYSFN